MRNLKEKSDVIGKLIETFWIACKLNIANQTKLQIASEEKFVHLIIIVKS